ncbi:MAG: hypothetical protein KGL39_34410 [Patescibacteria group bacterium]|nr:hypothetical protein [Patescibacteria group bacterium]
MKRLFLLLALVACAPANYNDHTGPPFQTPTPYPSGFYDAQPGFNLIYQCPHHQAVVFYQGGDYYYLCTHGGKLEDLK